MKEKLNSMGISLPTGFSVGFGRKEMNPPIPVLIALGGMATGIKDDLYATCIALSDGEKVSLLFHMDMKETPSLIFNPCAEAIDNAFGIPKENIIMNATHTHVSPHTTLKREENETWRKTLLSAVLAATKEALLDLAPARVFAGTGQALRFAFVRRYLLADGTFKTNPRKADVPLRSESVADPELRTLRFEREGKKDVLLVSWQAHYGASGTEITSDFVHHLREKTERDLGVLFAYFNGGSANINMLSRVKSLQRYSDYVEVGLALADVAKEALSQETEIRSGKIVTNYFEQIGEVIQDSPERKEWCKKILAAPQEKRDEMMSEHGFVSIHDVYSTNFRTMLGETGIIPLTVISCGAFAFTANPFEMFDVNAREIREGSPFFMTFALPYSNEHLGYMPPARFFQHGAYEVLKAFFVQGTADRTVEETVRMLHENRARGEMF